MSAGPTKNASGRAVTRAPIHEQILAHLRRDIIRNRWAPGERLPEPQLCEEFNVSRTPLRDALKLLEAEGLVELKPHVGAVVTRPGQPDLEEKMQVLSSLEQLAAGLVAGTRPPRVVAELRKLHAAMKDAAARKDAQLYYRLNDDFHRAIVVGSGNVTLSKIHETLMWHVFRARHIANEYEALSTSAAEHHEAIVDFIAEGKTSKASDAMRSHLKDVSFTISHSDPLHDAAGEKVGSVLKPAKNVAPVKLDGVKNPTAKSAAVKNPAGTKLAATKPAGTKPAGTKPARIKPPAETTENKATRKK
ncbi:MAG: ydfH 3 [Herminiimonas sp.]|nr:ydfH 3 [Herminiimonas sp.]